MPSPPQTQRLPNELLGIIVEGLCEPPVCEEEFSTDFLDVEWHKWRRSRRQREALRSLCLTSRALVRLSRPALYRDIIICNPNNLALLLRTVLESSGISHLIRRFAYIAAPQVPFTGEFPLHTTHSGMLDVWHREYDRLDGLAGVLDADRDDSHVNFTQTHPILEQEKPYHLFLDLLVTLLWLMPNAQAATFPLPHDVRTFNQSRTSTLFSALCYEDRAFPLFQSISTLRVWPHGHFSLSSVLDMAQFGLPLCCPPELTRLELIGDDGHWEGFPQPLGVEVGIKHIEHLVLWSSACSPCQIFDICNQLPALKTLWVSTDKRQGTYSLYPALDFCYMDGAAAAPMSPNNCLNNGLLLLKETLRSLHLRLEYRRDVTPLIGPDHKLTCLRSFTKLNILSLDMLLLLTEADISGSGENRGSLAHALPASITDLRLRVNQLEGFPHTSQDARYAWFMKAFDILYSFAPMHVGRLPELSNVELTLINADHRRFWRELGELAAAFRRQGVAFSYKSESG